MEFKKAYEALKQGALIKCPEWRGYWKWEDNSIKMHCKDGKTLDIRETKNVGYTLDFIPFSYTHLDVYKRQILIRTEQPLARWHMLRMTKELQKGIQKISLIHP